MKLILILEYKISVSRAPWCNFTTSILLFIANCSLCKWRSLLAALDPELQLHAQLTISDQTVTGQSWLTCDLEVAHRTWYSDCYGWPWGSCNTWRKRKSRFCWQTSLVSFLTHLTRLLRFLSPQLRVVCYSCASVGWFSFRKRPAGLTTVLWGTWASEVASPYSCESSACSATHHL